MNRPPPFANSEERDDARSEVRDLMRVRRYLAQWADAVRMAEYQTAQPLLGVPAMPSRAELDQTREVLHRVVYVLTHLYGQRCRNQDDVELTEAFDDRYPNEHRDNDAPI